MPKNMLTQLPEITMDTVTNCKTNILTNFSTAVKVKINATGCGDGIVRCHSTRPREPTEINQKRYFATLLQIANFIFTFAVQNH